MSVPSQLNAMQRHSLDKIQYISNVGPQYLSDIDIQSQMQMQQLMQN